MKRIGFVAGIVCAAFAAGCSGGDATSADQATYTRTIVKMTADGRPVVTTETVTAEEQRRDVEARAEALAASTRQQAGETIGSSAAAIARDTGCGGSSMWLFDRANLSGNEICFYGAGGVDLRSYPDGRWWSAACTSLYSSCTWAASVQSFWAGSDRGYFTGYGLFAFAPYARQDVANDSVAGATWLTLGEDPPPPN